ncbi:hypothetical protein JHK85_007022 [Glycine max]|nr:hypothetical protein JHK85_007022 [Glycine max]
MLDNLVGSLDLAKVKNSGKGKVLMQAMYGVKVETVFICRVFTVAFSGSSKKLSDLNVADIHSWALHFRRLQNLVNEEIRVRFSVGKFTVLNELEADGVDTVEIEWLLKTVEELRAGIEKLSQGNDLLAKGVDRFFEAVMTSRDTLLSSVIVPHATMIGRIREDTNASTKQYFHNKTGMLPQSATARKKQRIPCCMPSLMP